MDRQKAIEALRKDLGTIDLSKITSVPSISTGIEAFDLAMGGGFPEGRFSEVYGDWQSGKSLLLYQTIANCQRQGGLAFLLDSERSLDPRWVQSLGINMTELQYEPPETLEDGFSKIEKAIRAVRANASLFKDCPLLIVYDSLAASIARDELKQDFGTPEMAIRARVISSALRKMTNMIADYRVALVFVNQLRSKVGVLYGPTEETSGGRAPKFYASIRIALKKKKHILDGENIVGVNGEMVVVKSKVGIPFRSVDFSMSFKSGIGRFSGLADYLVGHGVFKKSGGWYTFGKRKFHEQQLPGFWDDIRDSVKEKLNTFSAPVDIDIREDADAEKTSSD